MIIGKSILASVAWSEYPSETLEAGFNSKIYTRTGTRRQELQGILGVYEGS